MVGTGTPDVVYRIDDDVGHVTGVHNRLRLFVHAKQNRAKKKNVRNIRKHTLAKYRTKTASATISDLACDLVSNVLLIRHKQRVD